MILCRRARSGGVVWRKKYIVGDLVSREMPWLENQGVYAGCGEKRECRGFEEIGGYPEAWRKEGNAGDFCKKRGVK